MPAFSRVLKQARERAGLTPGQLSYKAEMPEATIRRIEEGKIASPGIENIARMVKALKLNCDELADLFELESVERPRIASVDEAQPPPQVVKLSLESVREVAVELAHVVAPATAEAVVKKLRERAPGEETGRPLPPHIQERVREIAREQTAKVVRRWEELTDEQQVAFWEWLEEQNKQPAEKTGS